ncbi:MAG: DUF3820 family protein [Desulfobacterales bacterium]|nr:DUF3820 family protein [Desulfobacterales bacterium]
MTPDEPKTGQHVLPDNNAILKLAQATMPFGKYAGYRLVDLPAAYVVWLSRKGFPGGELGEMLSSVYEIKVNGLEYLFKPLKNLDI